MRPACETVKCTRCIANSFLRDVAGGTFDLREDPEAFKLLSTYGYDAERDFSASRADSPQVLVGPRSCHVHATFMLRHMMPFNSRNVCLERAR